MASYEDDKILIDYVKKFPLIYDNNNKYFKCRSSRKTAWAQIAVAIAMTAEECEHRFGILRNKYGSLKRKYEEGLKNGMDDVRPKWALYDSMQFMDKYIKRRRSGGSIYRHHYNSEDDPLSITEFPTSATTTTLDFDDNLSPAHSIFSFNSPHSTEVQKPNEDSTTEIYTNDNQFHAFGRTIAYMLTNIRNKKRQRRAMAAILQKISEYETESENSD